MLSRTAASLYWLGRYVERAEFTARLVEATVRLDALSSVPAGQAGWQSALSVLDADVRFADTRTLMTPGNVARFLTTVADNPGSVAACIDKARGNAKAVRVQLTRDAWTAINRAWLIFQTAPPETDPADDDTPATLHLVDEALAEARGFDGAIARMMKGPPSWFIRLGAAVERADNTARLIDVKYHLLLPEGQAIGGAVDRDQWTTILQTVAAVNAYRWLYREGLQARSVAELLMLRRELPRSVAGATEEAVVQLAAIGQATGFEGEADRLARARLDRLANTAIGDVIKAGLHEAIEAFLVENVALDQAIARQFRFV